MKNIILRFISIVMYLLAIVNFICAMTVKGGGFLDLSDLFRNIFSIVAIICIIISVITWKFNEPNLRKKKGIILTISILIVIIGTVIDPIIEEKFAPKTIEYIHVDLPFAIEDIENIEMYYYDGVSTLAEKKIVTETKDIEVLYNIFGDLLSPNQENVESADEDSITSFRFNLKDGKNYELIYSEGILYTTGDFKYVAEDISGNWIWLNECYESIQVEINELPKYGVD